MAMMLAQKAVFGRVVKPVYMLDSFEGLPPITMKDGANAEAFARGDWGTEYDNCKVDIETVRSWLGSVGLQEGDYILVKGWFDRTAPELATRLINSGIAVLRLDGDWYESTRTCLDNLAPIVSENGHIIIDDYYCFDGCARAVHDYLSASQRPCRIRTPSRGDGAYFRNLGMMVV